MIKAMELVQARSDRPRTRFHYYWRVVHGGLASEVSSFARYIQSHEIEPAVWSFPACGYSGIVEVWMESIDELMPTLQSAYFAEQVKPDEYNFADLEETVFYVAEDRNTDPAKIEISPTQVKAVLLLTRRPDLNREQFVEALGDLVPRLRKACPLIAAITMSVTVDAPGMTRNTPPDVLLDLWFDKLEDYDASAIRYAWVADLLYPICARRGITSFLMEPILKV